MAQKTWIRGYFACLTASPARSMSLGVQRASPQTTLSRQLRGDGADRFEIALGADREAGFDDVDAHRFEVAGDLQLFRQREGRAGGLLAVSQRRVENSNRFHNWLPKVCALASIARRITSTNKKPYDRNRRVRIL